MRKIPNHKFASPQTHRPCQKVHDGTDHPSPTHPLSPRSLPSYPIRTPSPLPSPSAPLLRTPPSPNKNLWISIYQRYRIYTCYTHNLDRDTDVLVLGPAGQVNVNGGEHTGSADRVGGGRREIRIFKRRGKIGMKSTPVSSYGRESDVCRPRS